VAREPAPAEVDRRYFEICLFTQVVNELKSGDLCIPGSEEYGDYRDQLVSWEEYNRDVAGYAEQVGVPVDPTAFVVVLKARLTRTADATHSAFPENEHVAIVDGEPVVKRLRAREVADGTAFLERLLKPRMVPVGVLEALADTEHWLGWTRHFGPVSGFEAKLERPANATSRPSSATAAALAQARRRGPLMAWTAGIWPSPTSAMSPKPTSTRPSRT